MITTTDYYLPLDIKTRKVYNEWIPQFLEANTFLVLSDPLILARSAALLSFNILKLYSTSSVAILCDEKDKNIFEEQLKAVGIPSNSIHHVKSDKQFIKFPDTTNGVFFVSASVMANIFTKHSSEMLDIKLMVICNAEKSDHKSANTKAVSAGYAADKTFRVLALTSADLKIPAKVQSAISNLQIAKILIKNNQDNGINELLFNQESRYIGVEYDSEELQLLLSLLTKCVEQLVAVGILKIKDIKALFFLDTEFWFKEVCGNIEHLRLIRFTEVLIGGYQILVQYGLRALFLYVSSRSQIFYRFEESEDLRKLKERLETVNFDAFPSKEKRNELNCHPKLKQLFDIVNVESKSKNPDKFLVFCSSPFGARAIAEYLKSARVDCIENVSPYHQLMEDHPNLQGPTPLEPSEVKKNFLGPVHVCICSTYLDNFKYLKITNAISMDYLTCGIRYTTLGRKSYCILANDYEMIPQSMRNYNSKVKRPDIKQSFKFDAQRKNNLKLYNPLKDYPLQYYAEKESLLPLLEDDEESIQLIDINNIKSVEEGDALIRKAMGDFSMDHFYDSVKKTSEFFKAKKKSNTKTYSEIIKAAYEGPVNPEHAEFARKLLSNEIDGTYFERNEKMDAIDFDDYDESEDSSQQKILFKPVQKPDYYKNMNDIETAWKEKIKAEKMYERQRWLCVVRDAINNGQKVYIGKQLQAEIDKLPASTQFWDYL